MRVKKMGKMMLHNGVFMGMALVAVMFLVKLRSNKRKQQIVRVEV